jgi:hypothetical protein
VNWCAASPVPQLWDDAIRDDVVAVTVWQASLRTASYDIFMESFDFRDLLQTALSRPGYGQTAEEILETCRLVAEAEQMLNKKEIFDIRQENEISEQTWKRLTNIGKNEVLWSLREKLPAKQSSLYRLTLLEPIEVIIGVNKGSIHQGTTSRDIEEITKRSRIDSRYKLSDRQIFFFEDKKLDDQAFSDLLEEINRIAKEYDCCFDTDNLENIRKTDARFQYDKRMADIRWLLRQDIENLQIIENLYEYDDIEDDREKEEVRSELIDMSFKDFVNRLMSIALSRESMMKDYGFLYCLKIAHEYWQTDSRSQRYNYKRRLMEVKSKYPDLEEDVNYVLEKFINLD